MIMLAVTLLYSGLGYSAPARPPAVGLSERNPFLPPTAIHCLNDQSAFLQPLKDWRLLGAIGQKDTWHSWVMTPQKQWLPLKKGSVIAGTDFIVTAITANFTRFNLRPSLTDCKSLSAIRLDFAERDDLTRTKQ